MAIKVVTERSPLMKFKNAKDIKYYLYVSDTKLNMLFEQIYETTKKTQKTAIGGKVLGLSASAESTEEESFDRDDKIKAVEEELMERKCVGTPEKPKDYFKGKMLMRWGMFDDCGTRPESEAPLVYFSGMDMRIPLIVGLGGSSKHVLGQEGATSTNSRSYTATIVRWLFSGLKTEQPAYMFPFDRSFEDQEMSGAMAAALHGLRPPTQELEFLAKTLFEGKLHGHEHMTGVPESKVLLGTPLYVTLTSHLSDSNKYGLDEDLLKR